MVDSIMFTSEIRAVLLLIIAVSSNFLGNTLNCGLQESLTNSPILRNLFLFLIVCFTIDFTSKSDSDPVDVVKRSFIIYIFYILLSKQNYSTLIVIFLLLVTVYFLYIKVNYETKQGNDPSKYQKSMDMLSLAIGGIAVIGFGFYLNRQYNEHQEDFDLLQFIFGKNKCDKM